MNKIFYLPFILFACVAFADSSIAIDCRAQIPLTLTQGSLIKPCLSNVPNKLIFHESNDPLLIDVGENADSMASVRAGVYCVIVEALPGLMHLIMRYRSIQFIKSFYTKGHEMANVADAISLGYPVFITKDYDQANQLKVQLIEFGGIAKIGELEYVVPEQYRMLIEELKNVWVISWDTFYYSMADIETENRAAWNRSISSICLTAILTQLNR